MSLVPRTTYRTPQIAIGFALLWDVDRYET